MPKLKNVTMAELSEAANQPMEAGQVASYIAQRAEQGYLDEVASPIQTAITFLSAASALSEVGRALILKASLQEQKRELEAKLRSKQP